MGWINLSQALRQIGGVLFKKNFPVNYGNWWEETCIGVSVIFIKLQAWGLQHEKRDSRTGSYHFPGNSVKCSRKPLGSCWYLQKKLLIAYVIRGSSKYDGITNRNIFSD